MAEALFDIKKVKEDAQAEIRKERADKAKNALIAQMRICDKAEQIWRGEKLKLEDIERQIADGTI